MYAFLHIHSAVLLLILCSQLDIVMSIERNTNTIQESLEVCLMIVLARHQHILMANVSTYIWTAGLIL
jgi:hypothetical protein